MHEPHPRLASRFVPTSGGSNVRQRRGGAPAVNHCQVQVARSRGEEGPGFLCGLEPRLPLPQRLALWLRSVTQPSGLPVPESGLGEASGVGSELARRLHSLSAAPGRPGLESGHQDLLRQHQPHGRPHLPAADEGASAAPLVGGRRGASGARHPAPARTPVSELCDL